jgi:peroxisomal coenzyme A diphosphatase NUDT7
MDKEIAILGQKLNSITKHTIPQMLDGRSAAAVLILLVKINQEWNIIYTRRTHAVSTHQGEVSFPGGAYEEQDQTLVQTALRETWEEIGIEEENIKILGGLDPVITITNYLVFPFIGMMKDLVDFKINENEVERVFLIPILWLKDRSNYYEQDHLINHSMVKKVIHYKDFKDEHLWGLTARITQQLLELME